MECNQKKVQAQWSELLQDSSHDWHQLGIYFVPDIVLNVLKYVTSAT